MAQINDVFDASSIWMMSKKMCRLYMQFADKVTGVDDIGAC
ncbi:MAG TPA: hypothetical protein VFW73_13630 [Lacipirellulaceae bacterium]|nr:hypothetical protein [Lacipirellulaceae bacterium]